MCAGRCEAAVVAGRSTQALDGMNTMGPMQAEVAYNRELLEAAAGCFIKQYFRSQGRWLLVACVVNAIGLAAILALGAKASITIALVVVIVATGPLYCLYLLTLFPRRYASKAARFLVPTAQVSFTAATFEVSARDRVSRIPWTSIKEVWECPTAFLLVISQFAVIFVVVPKSQLHQAAHEYLAGKVISHAA